MSPRRALLLRVLPLLLATAGQVHAQGAGPPLVSIKQVRDAAAQKTPVRVRGVVTWVEDKALYLQDETAAIVVETTAESPALAPGDEAEISGEFSGQDKGMVIRSPAITRIGTKPLPEAQALTLEQLVSTGFLCQRVRVMGSVHDVAIVKGRVRLQLQGRNVFVAVWFPVGEESEDALFNLTDALVEVTGVAHSNAHLSGDARDGRVMVSSMKEVSIINAGSADIFSRPTLTLAQMRERVSPLGERFKVTGVVTYASAAGWYYLKDDTGTCRGGKPPPTTVEGKHRPLQSNPQMRPGDKVELVGHRYNFETEMPKMPWLADCEWRVVDHVSSPPFEPVTVDMLVSGDFDGYPVSMSGEIVEISPVQRDFAGFFNHYLIIENGSARFSTLVQKETPERCAFQTGDYVQLNGVIKVDQYEPAGFKFRLNVNEFSDIQPTGRPLLAMHLERWLLGGALVALAAGVWIFFLRRSVRLQTARLAESLAALERFKAVADTTSDLVAMATMDGSPLYMNAAGRAMLGIGADEDVSRIQFADVYSKEANELFHREGFAHALVHGHWAAELRMKHRSGQEIPVWFIGLVIKSPEGHPLYMGCTARDISERLKMEQQLRDALDQERELNQLKSSFVNTISHEFRTPLGIILFAASMMRRFEARFGAEERAQQLSAIEEAVTRMNDLVEQSLSLGRADAAQPKMQWFDPRALCRRIADEVMSATSHRSPVAFEPGEHADADAHTDDTMLRAILINLVGNAVKYSPAGSPVELQLQRELEHAVFTVRDHGAGLREEDLPKLFTTFHRGANSAGIPGTGLGLAIVKRCTEALGGTVVARNHPDGGAEFVVDLPIYPSSLK